MPPKPSSRFDRPAPKPLEQFRKERAVKKGIPVSKPAKAVPRAALTPQPRSLLKTGVERPVLRAFECLVNVELAQQAMKGVGIFVGPDSKKQHDLHEQITQDLIQLLNSYRLYWKTVDIDSKSKADF